MSLDDGEAVKSNVFQNAYTHITATGFAEQHNGNVFNCEHAISLQYMLVAKSARSHQHVYIAAETV